MDDLDFSTREFYEAERDYWNAHYLYCDPEEGCYC